MLGLGLVVGVIVALTSGGGNSPKTPQSTGEIFLQAATAPGPDAFGPSAASALTPSATITGSPGSTGGSAASAPASTGRATSGPLVITAQSGGTPELYGGSKRLSVCDKAGMIAYLLATPAKAAAWAAVQGIPVSDLEEYITRLTPVVLRSDTRVTNHGYRNGRATPFQAILQAGTAVLVDAYGVPRARCACGNPLAPPVAVPTTPQYNGPPWPGFSPTNVTVINQSVTVINVITVIDIDTGQPLAIPINQAGPTGSSSPPPPASTSTSPVTSGWRLRTEKFVSVLGQPDYQISAPWNANGGSLTLTVHDNGYICGGSGGTETIKFSWTFGRDITDVANGDMFLATVTAARQSSSGACTTGLTERSAISAGTISGGSLPLTSFDRPPDPDRFTGATPTASDDSQGAKPTASGTLGVQATPSNPDRPESGFGMGIAAPGVEFFVLYVYDQI